MSVSSVSGAAAGGGGDLELIQTQVIGPPLPLQSVTFSGLAGDTDGTYLIRGRWTNGTAAVFQPPFVMRLHLLPNGLVAPGLTDTAIVHRFAAGPLPTNEDHAQTQSLKVAELNAHFPNMAATFEAMFVARSPFAGGLAPRQILSRVHSKDTDGNPTHRTSIIGATWEGDTSASITQLELKTIDGTGIPLSGIAPGSAFSLYKVKE